MQDKVDKDCNCKEVKNTKELKEAIEERFKPKLSEKLRAAFFFWWYQTEVTFSSIYSLFKHDSLTPKLSKRLRIRLQKELIREQTGQN